jgi:hypothetical protein
MTLTASQLDELYSEASSDLDDHMGTTHVDCRFLLQLVAIARAALALDAKVVAEILEESLDGYGLHTGGSYGVEGDHDGKAKILAGAAERIVARLRGAP